MQLVAYMKDQSMPVEVWGTQKPNYGNAGTIAKRVNMNNQQIGCGEDIVYIDIRSQCLVI